MPSHGLYGVEYMDLVPLCVPSHGLNGVKYIKWLCILQGFRVCTYEMYADSAWMKAYGLNLIAAGNVGQCGELVRARQT